MRVKFNSVVKHDNGKTKLYVWADNKEDAIKLICSVENCPKEAIIKIEIAKPTIAEIKARTNESAPHFFSAKTLKFFGQRMRDFKVYQEGEMFRICAPHKHGTTERLFNPFTNTLEFCKPIKTIII